MQTERTATDVFNNPQPGDWAQFRYPNEHHCIHVIAVLVGVVPTPPRRLPI